MRPNLARAFVTYEHVDCHCDTKVAWQITRKRSMILVGCSGVDQPVFGALRCTVPSYMICGHHRYVDSDTRSN